MREKTGVRGGGGEKEKTGVRGGGGGGEKEKTRVRGGGGEKEDRTEGGGEDRGKRRSTGGLGGFNPMKQFPHWTVSQTTAPLIAASLASPPGLALLALA